MEEETTTTLITTTTITTMHVPGICKRAAPWVDAVEVLFCGIRRYLMDVVVTQVMQILLEGTMAIYGKYIAIVLLLHCLFFLLPLWVLGVFFTCKWLNIISCEAYYIDTVVEILSLKYIEVVEEMNTVLVLSLSLQYTELLYASSDNLDKSPYNKAYGLMFNEDKCIFWCLQSEHTHSRLVDKHCKSFISASFNNKLISLS